jgi:DNA-binding Lrp family transcriptional regulator
MQQISIVDAPSTAHGVLVEEGRIPNVELAERVRLTPGPCLRRVQWIEASGVIRGYRAVMIRMRWGATISTGRMRDGPTIGRRSGSGYRVRPATRLMAPARMTAPNR